MSAALQAVLVGLLVLAASVWIGGFVMLMVVSRASRASLEEAPRVALFRQVGRTFLPIAIVAMVVALITGGVLLGARTWDGLATALVILVAAVIVATGLGVRQARAMTKLRRQALVGEGALATRVETGARHATALRTVIGLLVLALYVVAVVTATH
ncbi:hypothetical protein [Segeticoccus rhizosphaerae]|jgi:uncharacterized membrane protein|uniref:hypothetical protein n=1 Tax=Segeticoccus rhizosphaerae TaxID=1104777 RepID=UPI0010BF6862|nr:MULTISPECIES: hypothetical protein [Intrasporangiaceae]